MILEKHLTIREAKNEIAKLENELDVYLTKKKINFLKTQPGAMNYKSIISDQSHNIFDKFLHYQIRDEEYDTKIYSLQESIISYQQYVIKEMQRMSQYDEVGLICYLREEENYSWKEIDKELHRGEDYSRTKYKRYKQGKNCN